MGMDHASTFCIRPECSYHVADPYVEENNEAITSDIFFCRTNADRSATNNPDVRKRLLSKG